MSHHAEQIDRSITTTRENTSSNTAFGAYKDADIRSAHSAESTRRQADSARYENSGLLPAADTLLQPDNWNDVEEERKKKEAEQTPQQEPDNKGSQNPDGNKAPDQQQQKPGDDGKPGGDSEPGRQPAPSDAVKETRYEAHCPDGTVVRADNRFELAAKCEKVS